MLLLRYFLEQPLSLASMSALAVTYITAWCVPITQNGDCGHRQDKALCGKRCTSAIKRKHRSEEHTSELQSRQYLVCRLLLEKNQNHTQLLARCVQRMLSVSSSQRASDT